MLFGMILPSRGVWHPIVFKLLGHIVAWIVSSGITSFLGCFQHTNVKLQLLGTTLECCGPRMYSSNFRTTFWLVGRKSVDGPRTICRKLKSACQRRDIFIDAKKFKTTLRPTPNATKAFKTTCARSFQNRTSQASSQIPTMYWTICEAVRRIQPEWDSSLPDERHFGRPFQFITKARFRII